MLSMIVSYHLLLLGRTSIRAAGSAWDRRRLFFALLAEENGTGFALARIITQCS